MLRKLVDYKKLDHQLAALLIETYSDGYGDDDIIVFKNLKGETVEAVELRTNDTIYLVKISKSLSNFIANFEENIEKELEKTPQAELEEAENPNYEVDNEQEFESDDLD
ncbi:hypothetical protein D9O36_18920 [Zobellia amurskyensis]|uniref:DNA primase n=1 Tax=Zobellia amurskyensis TaxID=248905 RepID=A0A7X2ZWY7_9FLAO|nr:hypothetical protein [Zobellia amurskyensis]MUH37930.1 hypothetical protein [Zobellia amurskyensis]